MYWIGPQNAFSHKGTSPFELDLFPKLGVTVFGINAGKLQSKFTRYTIPALVRLPLGFWEAYKLVKEIKPKIIISFGGFVSVPVVLVSKLFNIPVVIQEQISGAGLANKITSHFAKKIFVARETSIPFYPKDKTLLIGLPISQEVQKIKPKRVMSKPPVLFVTGGSRGAQRVNNLIFECLPNLLEEFIVIHQVGNLDFELANKKRGELSDKMQKRYMVYSFIEPQKMHKLYEEVDILVGRAGANTVSEAMTANIPSIFIPIPWSIGDEQTKNAMYAQKYGIGFLLKEENMNKANLLSVISKIKLNWKSIKEKALQNKVQDKFASKRLRDEIVKLI